MIPRRVQFLAAMPRTATGKIDRRALARPPGGVLMDAAAAARAGCTPQDRGMRRQLARTLGRLRRWLPARVALSPLGVAGRQPDGLRSPHAPRSRRSKATRIARHLPDRPACAACSLRPTRLLDAVRQLRRPGVRRARGRRRACSPKARARRPATAWTTSRSGAHDSWAAYPTADTQDQHDRRPAGRPEAMWTRLQERHTGRTSARRTKAGFVAKHGGRELLSRLLRRPRPRAGAISARPSTAAATSSVSSTRSAIACGSRSSTSATKRPARSCSGTFQRHRRGHVARHAGEVPPDVRRLRALLGDSQVRQPARSAQVPPRTLDRRLRRRSVQEEVERLPDAALLALPRSEGRPLPQLNVDNPKYRLAIDTWRKLPLAVTQLVGPSLARGIP